MLNLRNQQLALQDEELCSASGGAKSKSSAYSGEVKYIKFDYSIFEFIIRFDITLMVIRLIR